MAEERLYGVEDSVDFLLVDRTSGDIVTGASFAAGDCTIVKDQAAPTNTANLPTEIGNGWYNLVLTAEEHQAKKVAVLIADQTDPKAWADTGFLVNTYGNAAAQHAVNRNDPVRAGMTALPAAAPAAAGGLPTVDANNRIAGIVGTKNTLDQLNDIAATAIVTSGPIATNAGVATADMTHIKGSPITETGAGQLAAGLSFFFDVVTPAKTMNDVGGGSGGGEKDWTDTERNQIRFRLGMDGVTSTPSASPDLARPADIVSAGPITTSSGAVVNVTNCANNADMRGTDGASTHTATQVWTDPATRTVTGGTIDTNNDMRGTDGASTHTASEVWTVPATRTVTGGTIDTNNDMRGTDGAFTGSEATITAAVLGTTITEDYAANGAEFNLGQGLYAVHQLVMGFQISGVSYLVRNLANNQTVFQGTLDDADNPTSLVRT